MTGRLSWALAVMAMLGSSSASAEEPQAAESSTSTSTSAGDVSGLELTVGVGFQVGAGYVYKNGLALNGEVRDVKLSDAANGGIALLLEAGYRLSPKWYIGALGQYTQILVKENPYSCPPGYDCSTYSFRFGPQVQYHFSPEASFDPFVGLGFGMVLLNSRIQGPLSIPTPAGTLEGNLDIDSKTRGPEFVNVTVGGKWRMSEALSFGPYLTATYARYTVRAGTSTVSIPAINSTTTANLGPVDDGPYGLLILGVRGTWNL